MSYIDDKIKILEMICAEMIPWELCAEEQQHVVLDENDFKREGFSFNGALVIIKDIFNPESINKIDLIEKENGNRAMHLSIVSEIDGYLKTLKYPETQFFDEQDYLDGALSTPSKIFVVIDDIKGIYRSDKPEQCYKIQNPSARFDIVKKLFVENKVSLSKLSEIAKHKSSSLTIKEIKKINDCFRKALSLGAENDFIISINTGGYSLNRDKFDITSR